MHLARTAEAIRHTMAGHTDGIGIEATGMAAEHLCAVIDAVAAMFATLGERVNVFANREVVGNGRDSALILLEEAALDLGLGGDGLAIARRLLGNGRGRLLTVEGGEDV